MTQRFLLQDQATVGRGGPVSVSDSTPSPRGRSIQVSGFCPTAMTCTVKLYACNDVAAPIELATITLSGTGVVTDFFDDSYPFEFYIAELTAITGAGATVNVAASI